jgi:maltose/moltooligosaccharide transporter
MAAGLLWLLDTSANISMEPFRAFVGDLLPPSQRTKGFAMQSLFIGLGSVIASILPWVLTRTLKLGQLTGPAEIPLTVKVSFYIGAAVFLSTVLWTVLTTEEKPPKDMAAFRRQQDKRLGIGSTIREISTAIRDMPLTMRQLAWVQGFSWLGMYCMFLYFPPAVAHNIFGAYNETSPMYAEGIEWAGVCIAVYNAVCFVVSLILPRISALFSRQITHALCLLLGGVGLISLQLVHDRYTLMISMLGVGCAWASMLAMPYAMLVGALPDKKSGIYMGIFNFFIVLPEIVASLGLSWMMEHWFNDDRLLAVVLGGGFMLMGAIATLRVKERNGVPATAMVAEKSGKNALANAGETKPQAVES